MVTISGCTESGGVLRIRPQSNFAKITGIISGEPKPLIRAFVATTELLESPDAEATSWTNHFNLGEVGSLLSIACGFAGFDKKCARNDICRRVMDQQQIQILQRRQDPGERH